MSSLQIIRVGDLIASTIFFYDFTLTFPAEIHHFWQRPKLNWGSVLFFFNRYFALSLHILITIQVLAEERQYEDTNTCAPIQITRQGGIVFVQLLCAAIMIMRVYALYQKSRLVLAFLWVLTTAVLGFSIWAFFFNPSATYHFGHDMGCVRFIDSTTSLHLAIAWGGQLFFDVVIFLLTVWRSCHIRNVNNRPLIDGLLRDGAMYFAILSAANATNISILLLSNPDYKSIGGVALNSLTAVMASRLMINLRETTPRKTTRTTQSTLPTMTTVIPMQDISEFWSEA